MDNMRTRFILPLLLLLTSIGCQREPSHEDRIIEMEIKRLEAADKCLEKYPYNDCLAIFPPIQCIPEPLDLL